VGTYIYNDAGEEIGRIAPSMSYDEYREAILNAADLSTMVFVSELMAQEEADFVCEMMKRICEECVEEEGNWPDQNRWWNFFHAAVVAAEMHRTMKTMDKAKGYWK
jgi:uncharacterized protein YifN (PemK superfamily)